MISIASLFDDLFDDEQLLLNRVWVGLLGLQALLVLFGIVSVIVQSILARRQRKRLIFALASPMTPTAPMTPRFRPQPSAGLILLDSKEALGSLSPSSKV